MTDLLHTIPEFPTKSYTHLLPSLEKHCITTTDLLTLDALEIAKRAQLPLLDVRRLINHVITILQGQLGLSQEPNSNDAEKPLRKCGKLAIGNWSTISFIDDFLDGALKGGIPTGYITEITGERYDTVLFMLVYRVALSNSLGQRYGQNPAAPHSPTLRPTPPSPWPLPPNPLYLHRASSSHLTPYTTTFNTSPLIFTSLPSFPLPDPYPPNA